MTNDNFLQIIKQRTNRNVDESLIEKNIQTSFPKLFQIKWGIFAGLCFVFEGEVRLSDVNDEINSTNNPISYNPNESSTKYNKKKLVIS
jgi:hypothetical protein